MKRFITLSLFFFLVSVVALQAQIRLPRFFADGMVLQRDAPIRIWGWAPAGTAFDVSLSGHKVHVQSNAEGQWCVLLPKMKAGGPYELRVGDVCIRDVLVGDVFLCSGQSNMELPIRRCMDAVGAKVRDYTNTQIRYLKLPHQFNYVHPNNDVQTNGWQAVTPQNAGEMGALCYFLGRYLQEAKHVPVGIINSSVGGTRVACWMSRDTLLHHTLYQKELQQPKYFRSNWPDSVRRAETQRANEWEREMQRKDEISSRWRSPHYDFAGWTTVDIFSNWTKNTNATTLQSVSQTPIYGSYWFRQCLRLTADEAQGQALLRLGAMKDADSVFVNGRFVGFTSYEYPPRNYIVPSGVLHEGDNDIVIKLMAQGGHPNFTAGKLYQLETANGQTKPLGRMWQMTRGAVMQAKPGSTYFVDTPTGLYNAMIAPLGQLAFKGVVWYQGESDQGQAAPYSSLLSSLIRNWRHQFGRQQLPFVIVQLANFMQRHDAPLRSSGWCDIRQGQYVTTTTMPHVALATAIDLGEFNDIHPQRKDELGRRVALQMRRLAYGDKHLVAEGPRPLSAGRKADKIVVRYDRGTGNIVASASLTGFTLVEQGKDPVAANAQTVDAHTIEVDVPAGYNPQALRYAYDDNPVLSVYNEIGLPSPAFILPIVQ